MFVLGLDVSTACTGWAVFSKDGKFIDMGSIVLSKNKGLYTKAEVVRNTLSDLLIKYPINKVFIEEKCGSCIGKYYS